MLLECFTLAYWYLLDHLIYVQNLFKEQLQTVDSLNSYLFILLQYMTRRAEELIHFFTYSLVFLVIM